MVRSQTACFVDGYHGGVYGHYPEGYTRFIVDALKQHPSWKINLEIEPETWDRVKTNEDHPPGLVLQYSGVGLWGRRHGIAGPTAVRYALVPHSGRWDRAGISGESAAWNEPLMAVLTNPNVPAKEGHKSMLELSNPGWEATTMLVEGKSLFIRLFFSETKQAFDSSLRDNDTAAGGKDGRRQIFFARTRGMSCQCSDNQYNSLMKVRAPIAVLVIPTFNECESIGKMIDYLSVRIFPKITNWRMKVLVVDGHSPDGTGKIVLEKAKIHPDIFLYEETSKDGLGAAYLKGFKYATEELKADAVFEFDADFQHPPEMIPPMLREIDNGYDYVIGSRKVAGGSNPKGWGAKRIFLSEAGGLTARLLLFFPFRNFFKVTDPTTGLKVTRVKGCLDRLNLDFKHLHSRGFAYKMQLLAETLKLGVKFKEVPLVFQVRTTGESKIERNAVVDGIRVCALTRWRQMIGK